MKPALIFISGMLLATQLWAASADGIVLTSGIPAEADSLLTAQLGEVRVPALSVRKDDPCRPSPADDPAGIIAALKNSPKAEEITVQSTVAAGDDPCQIPPTHGYLGLEEQLADKIARWIKTILRQPDYI